MDNNQQLHEAYFGRMNYSFIWYCYSQVRQAFLGNRWRQFYSKEKPLPYTEIEIDSKGTLYMVLPDSVTRINMDKKKRKEHGTHS